MCGNVRFCLQGAKQTASERPRQRQDRVRGGNSWCGPNANHSVMMVNISNICLEKRSISVLGLTPAVFIRSPGTGRFPSPCHSALLCPVA